MEKAKHTPGPWKVGVYKYGERKEYRIVGSFDLDVAVLPVTNSFDDYDARLIAAAPDLLEALQEMWDAHEHNTSGSVSKLVLDAINKATGTTQ